MELFGATNTENNEAPDKASRPFDKKRKGPVMSDGGAVLILESLESAIKRKSPNIYCEIAGFRENTEPYHILRPTEDGIGLVKAMRDALVEAGVTPSQVDSINAHATSTPLGDKSEATAIKTLFGNHHCWNDLEALRNAKFNTDDDLLKDINLI